MSNGVSKMTDKSAKAYYREFTKVMEAADVVLQVCDARDPMGTRCKQVEETVMNSSSKGTFIGINAESGLLIDYITAVGFIELIGFRKKASFGFK